MHCVLQAISLHDDNVGYESSETHNNSLTKEHQDSADARDNGEPSAVSDNEEESGNGGGAEPLVSQHDLDVSVLGDIADSSVEAEDAAADAAEDTLGDDVLSNLLLELPSEVLESQLDHLHYSNNQTSKRH